LRDPFSLPAKHTLTNLVPSGWINDELISERKEGLTQYLISLLHLAEIQDHPILVQFLAPGPFAPFGTPQIRRDVPAVRMKSKSLACVAVKPVQSRVMIRREPDLDGGQLAGSEAPIAGAYYPSWAVVSLPPEKIAFSKYDIIFFGEHRSQFFGDDILTSNSQLLSLQMVSLALIGKVKVNLSCKGLCPLLVLGRTQPGS
jgi:chitinase